MAYISESQPVGTTLFKVLDIPEVTCVRVTTGMITTSKMRMSFACLNSEARLAGSFSERRLSMIVSKAGFW